MKRKMILIILLTHMTLGLFAEKISDGWWAQTASTAGDVANIAMEVKSLTPHIISLDSNNGWVGFAWYVEEKDTYTGFFELEMPKSEDDKDNWAGEVFQFILNYDGLTLTMKSKSSKHEFMATFWKKAKN